jgi:hypothetical protein
MKEVEYDLDSFGIPVYISGDSLLVVSWLQGVWRVLNRTYQERVNRMINQLDNMCQKFGIRPACQGREVVDHTFREWNTRADVLTHTARVGPPVIRDRIGLHAPQLQQVFRVCGIRAGFDGGVSCDGVGVGCWIDVGRVSRLSRQPLSHEIIWTEVYSAAFSIDPTSTVTDAEVSAVEHTIMILPRVVQAYFGQDMM